MGEKEVPLSNACNTQNKTNEANSAAIVVDGSDGKTLENKEDGEAFSDIELGEDSCSNNTSKSVEVIKDDDEPTSYLSIDGGPDRNIVCGGACVICFEEFKVDDVVVWSEDVGCGHVYHKECMVSY